MELEKMIKHFFHLYGRRSSIFLSGLEKRINFLSLAIGGLQDAIRKGVEKPIVGVALAKVVARIFCIAENFKSLSLVEAMTQKYPTEGCSYCGHSPCVCSEERPEPKLKRSISLEQSYWSLQKWCWHLKEVYGQKNKEKSIENLLNRLFKETNELLTLAMEIPNMSDSLADIEKKFALELADALAWTIAVANLLGINLEKAVLDRYGAGCWKCGRFPCVCGQFRLR